MVLVHTDDMGSVILEIEVLSPQELSPSRMARWAELQATDIVLDSPFLSPAWARAVEHAQGKSNHGFRVAVVSEAGRDVAFLPMRTGPLTAIPIGAPMCDYQALIAEPGHQLDPLDLVRAAGVQRFDFTCMLESQLEWAPYARGRDLVHVIDVADGYDAYSEERRLAGSGMLKDLDKRRRKAEREYGSVRFTAYSRSQADFDTLLEWKSKQFQSTGQTDIFKQDWTRSLVNDLFQSRDPNFGATLFTLHLGDRLAAVHLHMRGRRTIHAWLICHDPMFDRTSPGLMLFQDILRWMDDTPFQRFDLGPGDYQFKRSLANSGQWVTHGFVGLPSPLSLVREAAYSLRSAAESLPLGKLSALPGKAMRRMDIIRSLA
jgi:CelD/BcsL family acetyltransferase involved in cellulose biosynthesis